MDGQGGYFTQVGASLKTPFSGGMSWTQLAAVVVFVLTIALAWRQIVIMITNEV